MQTALVDTLAAAIQGADDLNEKLQALASNLLTTLGQLLFRTGLALIGDANPDNILENYLAPELVAAQSDKHALRRRRRRLELFIPGQSGGIISNDAFVDAANAMAGSVPGLCRKQRSRCYVTGNQQRQHRDATTTASDGTNRGWFQQQPHFPRHASYQQCRIRNDGSGSSSRSAICESSTGAGLPGTQELACSS